jgi:hypothetical protein
MGLVAVRKHPGVEMPGYSRFIPLGRTTRGKAAVNAPQSKTIQVFKSASTIGAKSL